MLKEENSEINDIDYFKILKIIVDRKKLILKSIILFSILGVIVAIFTPNKYETDLIFMPQGSKKGGGSFKGLAAIAGINVGGNDSGVEIPHSLYSTIVNSVPFQRELLKTSFFIPKLNKNVTYKDYYTKYNNPSLLQTIKKYTIGLPGLVISKLKSKSSTNDNVIEDKGNRIYRLTKEEEKLFLILSSQIKLNVNEKDGSIQISTTSKNPTISAEITKRVQELLEKYIIDLKIKKSSMKLDFIRDRYEEKKKEFKVKQNQLALYKDRNLGLGTSISRVKLNRLESEFSIAFDVFNELAKQLESQQIQVKEDTPVFTIVKPVVFSTTKAKPSRIFIVLLYIFVGALLPIIYIFGIRFYKLIKQELNSLN